LLFAKDYNPKPSLEHISKNNYISLSIFPVSMMIFHFPLEHENLTKRFLVLGTFRPRKSQIIDVIRLDKMKLQSDSKINITKFRSKIKKPPPVALGW
jgi:hypothetical protein